MIKWVYILIISMFLCLLVVFLTTQYKKKQIGMLSRNLHSNLLFLIKPEATGEGLPAGYWDPG